MKRIDKEIYSASRVTLGDMRMLGVFVFVWFALFAFMFSIPLKAIPGNSLRLQAELFKLQDYVILIGLSGLSALSLAIQVNVFRMKYASITRDAGSMAVGGMGIASGIVSSLFASATCASCMGALFGFLGFNTLLILIDNRWYILSGAFLLLGVSLYLASRRFNRGCELCIIKIKQ